MKRGASIAFAIATVAVVVAIARLVIVAQARPNLIASDLVKGYLPGARRFLDTGSPYEAYQLAGDWSIGFHTFIHPPSALPLFVPFLWLPTVLWWLVPLAVVGAALWRLRPAPWALAVIALLLCWPRSTGAILAGNTDIWAAAAVAAGAAWGWPIVLLAVKPTFAPLALVAVGYRSAWIAGAVTAVLLLGFGLLWIEWVAVIRNAGLSLAYSLLNLPLVAIGVVAYVGSQRFSPGRIRRSVAWRRPLSPSSGRWS